MVTITPAPPSGPGALAGFRLACECGLTWGTSLQTIASAEARAHEAYHASKANSRRRAA